MTHRRYVRPSTLVEAESDFLVRLASRNCLVEASGRLTTTLICYEYRKPTSSLASG